MRVPAFTTALVALAVAGGVLTADGSLAAPSATPRCATSELVVWLDTRGGGAAAGSAYYKLELANLSGHTCTLRGYPGVSAVDLRGRQLGSAASRDPAQAPRAVRLARGASAVATLRIGDAVNYPAPRCREQTAAGLRVYPPGETASRVVPFPFLACSRAGPLFLSVRAVRHA